MNAFRLFLHVFAASIWVGGQLVLAVVLTGVGAAVHQNARGNKAMLAAGGAASAIFAVAAMYLGFLVTPVP